MPWNNAILSIITRPEALKRPAIYLAFAINTVLGIATGLLMQVPAVLSGLGYAATQVGLLMSAYTAGNEIGNILYGALYGKVGLKKGGPITFSLFALSFLCFLNKATAIPAVLFFAVGSGMPTTYMPLVTRKLFGPKEYAAIWSVVSMGSSIGGFIDSPIYGTVYDVTRSYLSALLASPVILFVMLFVQLYLLKARGGVRLMFT